MTDAELSRELALALGWKYVYPHSSETDSAWFHRKRDYIAVSEGPGPRGTMLAWRKFNYRDPTVVVPLIKWLMVERDAKVYRSNDTWRHCVYAYPPGIKSGRLFVAATLEEAVARAVIAVRRG